MRAAILLRPIRAAHHAERTGDDAVAAAVADVVLNVHVAELVIDDRASGTGMLARRARAVLAHIAEHQPSGRLSPIPIDVDLLVERHVPPGRAGKMAGVVVAVAGEVEPV